MAEGFWLRGKKILNLETVQDTVLIIECIDRDVKLLIQLRRF